MKVFLPFFMISLSVCAQPCRYLNRVFDQVSKVSDVVYANVPSIPVVYVSENVTTPIDLTMDIWLPLGDTLNKRPMIVLAHGGGFISGSKENQDMQALADTFAHYGFVTASINYRINLNAASTASVERAIWRATQDGSAAIRYLKEKQADYGIDTSKVFVLGSSAGAFLWYSLLYCSNSERNESTFEGFLRPDLGCNTCTGNEFIHSHTPAAMIGCWGAMQQTEWISPNEYVPTLMFHGSADPVVPYNEGFPFSALFTAPWVYGSQKIAERFDEFNASYQFFTGENQLHEYWGVVNGTFPPGPINDPDYPDIIERIASFLTEVMQIDPCNVPVTSQLQASASEQRPWLISGNKISMCQSSTKPLDLRIWDISGRLAERILLKPQGIATLTTKGLVLIEDGQFKQLIAVE